MNTKEELTQRIETLESSLLSAYKLLGQCQSVSDPQDVYGNLKALDQLGALYCIRRDHYCIEFEDGQVRNYGAEDDAHYLERILRAAQVAHEGLLQESRKVSGAD